MKILNFIADNLAPLTLLGAIVAFFYPPAFLIFKDVFLWLFAATMFSLGLVLKPEELNDTLQRPKAIAQGLLTQYTVMPLLGFVAAWAVNLPPEVAVGLIIVACAPGAMASNVVVFLAGGAVAYSIALTTVATLLSPLLTPALVQWLGGAYLPVEFWPLMKTILLTVVLPLFLGMMTRRLLGERATPLVLASPAIAVIAIVVICSYAIATNESRLLQLGPALLGAVILVNMGGYLAGWLLARAYGFDLRHQVALSIEIGMQNAGLGVALALKHFPPEAALPGALFAVWCVLTAAGFSSYLRRRQRLNPS
ncbi:MAG: bile acid:sodium symporter family protein [Gammaproteobacteria bacterium]|nr:bile acid:sodium symporter family protein [Gammaproteobacteria bacterium]